MISAQAVLWLTNLVIGIVESIIALRILLKLLGASTIAPFVRWVYQTSQPLLSPFEGMFPSSRLPGGPFTLEFSALFALIIYGLVGYLISEGLHYITYHASHFHPEERPRKKRQVIEEEE